MGASTDGRFEGQPVLGSPGKALILSLPPARLYRAGLGRFWADSLPVCIPTVKGLLPASPPAAARAAARAAATYPFLAVTFLGPGGIVSSCRNQPMLGPRACGPNSLQSVGI